MRPARQPRRKPEPPTPARAAPRLVAPDAELAAKGTAIDAEINRHLRVVLTGANVLGAVIVFVFLYWVVPVPNVRTDQLNMVNAVAFLVALVVAMPLGAYLSLRLAQEHRDWLRSGRPWDARHRQLVLRFPLRQAKVEGVLWGSAALVFGAINATEAVALGIEVAVSIFLAGLATTALCYLMTERALRPVTALALASGAPARPVVPGVAVRMVLAWAFGTGIAVLGSGLVAATFLHEGHSPRRVAATILFLTAIALVAGLATLLIAARSIADPVESVRIAMAEVEAGNVSAEVPVYDGSEVGLLQAGFNRMAAGLRERDRIRDLFGRHVGEDVARDALARGIRLGGEVREAAVLFVDLIGSTALAATKDPTSVLATLNRFFDIVVEVVTAHGGWVNKFEGDAALCAFGAPTPHPDAATGALAAGRELCSRLSGELDEVEAAVGLSAGEVVAGNVGAARRFEYTVIGDPVNEAARLTELAKVAPSRLLASEAILSRAAESERSRWELGKSVVLRGRPEPTRIATPR